MDPLQNNTLIIYYIYIYKFFLTSKDHSVTQTWGGLSNQTGIERPTKCSFLWNDLAVLAKKSTIWLCTRGTWVMLKAGKHICSVSIFSNSVEKLGHAWGSFTIAISSLQSVPKFWQVECCSIFSIAHCSASTSECKDNSRQGKFLVPISWVFPKLSIHVHPLPLKLAEDIQDPSIKQKYFSSLRLRNPHLYYLVPLFVPLH